MVRGQGRAGQAKRMATSPLKLLKNDYSHRILGEGYQIGIWNRDKKNMTMAMTISL